MASDDTAWLAIVGGLTVPVVGAVVVCLIRDGWRRRQDRLVAKAVAERVAKGFTSALEPALRSGGPADLTGRLPSQGRSLRQPTPVPVVPVAPPRASVALDRDAGLFAPISDAEAKRQSAGGALLRNLVATGLSGLIPPAGDPRTLLIDGVMVGHGLITPEQLVEIHRVGEAFEKVRGDAQTIERRVRRPTRRG